MAAPSRRPKAAGFRAITSTSNREKNTGFPESSEGEDRHWAGSGRILIEASAVEEYLAFRNLQALDLTRYEITESVVQTDIAKFREIENHSEWKLYDEEGA